jgi:hypothetical protein
LTSAVRSRKQSLAYCQPNASSHGKGKVEGVVHGAPVGERNRSTIAILGDQGRAVAVAASRETPTQSVSQRPRVHSVRRRSLENPSQLRFKGSSMSPRPFFQASHHLIIDLANQHLRHALYLLLAE